MCLAVLAGVLFLMGSNDDIRSLVYKNPVADIGGKADIVIDKEPLSVYHDVDKKLYGSQFVSFENITSECEKCGGNLAMDEIVTKERAKSMGTVSVCVETPCIGGKEGYVDCFESNADAVFYSCDKCGEIFKSTESKAGYGTLAWCEKIEVEK